MNEPRGLTQTSPEKRLFPDVLNVCAMCGGLDSFEDPIRLDTWGLPYVSEPFPAHRGCMTDFLEERLTEQEMREAIS